MRILNVVFFLLIKFNIIQKIFFIANFVKSNSIYNKIPSFNLPNPNNYVVFDLLDEDLDNYYPLGLTVKSGPNSQKEFFVDNLITFGKDVKIVFGNKCVSLTSFARNIKATLTWDILWYKVNLEYDLHGSKIIKKFEEEGVTVGAGYKRKFNIFPELVFEDSVEDIPETLDQGVLSDDEMEAISLDDNQKLESQLKSEKSKPDTSSISKEELEHYDPTSIKETDTVEKTIVTETLGEELDKKEETVETVPSIPSLQVSSKGEIDITQTNLHSAPGYKDSDTVVTGSVDFRCVYFDNVDDVYNKLLLKSNKLYLPQTAESFEICYREDKGDYYILVSSMFSTVLVEQTYKSGTFGLSPIKDFSHFTGLKTLFDRRIKSSRTVMTQPATPLNLDSYEPDENSFLEKITCGKCNVFRYIDGLETEDRVGSITSVLFGDFEFFVKQPKRFVMASVCNPYLSTIYVSIMVKEAFVYENKIFYSSDGKLYHERKHLQDEERLNIINMTSKIWHQRYTNGKLGNISDGGEDNTVEVLCLNQFTGTKTTTSKSCKDIEHLQNFKIQFNSKDMTHLYYKKNKPKSSILIGNVIFDIKNEQNENIRNKYIYISHPENEPISVLVVEKYNEAYAIIETIKGSNMFIPINETLENYPTRFSRKDVNVAIYKGSMYGITWDYNDALKTHYLFPSNFPDYCLGDLTFHNMKIISYRGEGYKQISTKDKDKLVNIKVIAVLSKKKVELNIEVDGKNTNVEWTNPPSKENEEIN